MDKFTIIAPTEYEGIIVDVLGKSGVVQLKEVTDPALTNISTRSKEVDFKALYEKTHARYTKLLEYLEGDVEISLPQKEAFDRFSEDPLKEVERVVEEQGETINRLRELKLSKDEGLKALVEELQRAVEALTKEYEAQKEKLENSYNKVKVRLESVKALGPDELKRCFAVGVVKDEFVSSLINYLKVYPEISYKLIEVTRQESFVYIFGSEQERKWVESLFLIFNVKDIFDFLNTGDILLVLDPEKRKSAIERYRKELREITSIGRVPENEPAETEGDMDNKIQILDKAYKKKIEDLRSENESRMKQVEAKHNQEIDKMMEKLKETINDISSLDHLLGILSNEKLPIMRTKVISVFQGWISDANKAGVESSLRKIESDLGVVFYLEYEKPSAGEFPPSSPRIPSVLRPFYTLTSMLGTPSSREINPTIIFTLMWVGMFGFMFPDVGQGLVIAVVGLITSLKVKKRMMGLNFAKIGKLFIALGISSAIFGFLFGSFFLIEFQPILFKPLDKVWVMIKISFYVGIIEITFALLLGIINRFMRGDRVGALMGEKGLGGLITFGGIIWMIFAFWHAKGVSGITPMMPLVLIVGVTMIFIEPIVHARVHHEKEEIMDLIFQGFGAAFESLISLMSNAVSFARLAGFALAHVAFATVVLALGKYSAGMGLLSLVAMNFLALSIEFMVVMIQALRLLYYEFSTKFYFGDGKQFKPFSVKHKS
jgi:vacuolar-type H+-ATPase subunit I/STV1